MRGWAQRSEPFVRLQFKIVNSKPQFRFCIPRAALQIFWHESKLLGKYLVEETSRFSGFLSLAVIIRGILSLLLQFCELVSEL